ncbi:MobQ family relaxase [Citrobacter koseri]|uniref:MobQ family relaxase n=1 Tax=Citrobacter koseri TaxID=545 RepID=UPI0038925752
MAIYSFKMENISRGEGKSSVASAAYRHRKVFTDNRTGDIHGRKTAHKKDLAFAQIFAPENTPPDLIIDSETLWNSVEASEKRKDARLAKEFKIALPAELTPEQSIELTTAFVLEHFTKKGIIADVVIHDINSHNPHIHIMGTTREVLTTGFGKKVREWDTPETLDGWRKGWQDVCNEFLEKYEHEARIDHRSIAAQHEEALEQAAVAVTNEEKAVWLAKAEETDRAPMRHIPRGKWNTKAAQEQRAEEQAIRDDKKEEAKKTYTLFKELPLEIVVDLRSFTVSVLAEPEEIVLTDTGSSSKGTFHGDVVPDKPAFASILETIGSPAATIGKPSLSATPGSPARGRRPTPASLKRKRRKAKPREDGIFKRFTLMIVDFIRDKFIWAKKPTPKFDVAKPKVSKYVYDEVLGIPVRREEYERRRQFNRPEAKPKVVTVERFPSRQKHKPASVEQSMDYVPSSPSTSSRSSIPKLKPPGYRDRNDSS